MTEVTETDSPWWRARRVQLGALALAVVIAALGVGFLLSDDDDKVTLPFPGSEPLLGPGGQALAQLLSDARDETFHIKYKATGGEGVRSLEWWNRRGRSRQDTVLEGEGKRATTASFLSGDEAHTCARVDNGAWSCREVAAQATSPTGLLEALVAQLSGRTIVERRDSVAGRTARCFSVAARPDSEAVEVCTNTDGVPLRIATGSAGFEVESLDKNVPDSVFDRPA
jgi:hypothetical protein